ncbi:MAG: hypothetical protein Q9191_006092, partial [Dirinaria sp. TL-2023a]
RLSNGRVVLCLSAGLEQNQFRNGILRTFESLNASDEGTEFLTNPQGTAGDEGAASYPNPTSDPNSSQTTLVSPSPSHISSADLRSPSSSEPAASGPISSVQSVLEERRQRLERDKREKDAKAKAERRAIAEARRDTNQAEPGSAKSKQASYAQQQRKRQQEAKSERERILRDIENDKAARREKEEQRKALAKAEAEAADGADGLANEQLAREDAQSKSKSSSDCALQIRLFDGSTIRHRFPSDQTLRSHVRPWIEEQRSDGATPFTLKHILTPMPNRTLSISDEEDNLQSLGLAPSATLVMVPVQGYTSAYADDSGLLSRGVSACYNIVTAGAGMITGALGTFLGIGHTAPHPEQATTAPEQSSPQASTTGSKINVRTLRDQRSDRDDHQLYNGNQLNFEPRKDQDEKEE